MMKVKLEFVRSDSDEKVVVEFDVNKYSTNALDIFMEYGSDGHKYVWPYGSFNVFNPEGNVLCAKHVDVKELHIHMYKQD